jgi:hypothetical protein
VLSTETPRGLPVPDRIDDFALLPAGTR